jgi:peptide/nickel transport system permease protein
VLGRILQDRRGKWTVGFLAFLVLVMILAPVLAPHDPNQQSPDILMGPFSDGHVLGTDDLGRDVLSRLIYGTQVSVSAAAIALVTALAVGLPMGIAAGYLRGWVDAVLMRVADTLLSFPGLIFAIAIAAVLGPSLFNSMFAIGVVFSPTVARLIRAQMISVQSEVFMDAARTFGIRGHQLIFRHALPNAVQPSLVQCSILLARGLIAEGSLSFLGLGVQPPTPSWGAMLSRAYAFIREEPVQMIAPGLAIVISALAFNILGDVVQTALDPKRRKSRRSVTGSAAAEMTPGV